MINASLEIQLYLSTNAMPNSFALPENGARSELCPRQMAIGTSIAIANAGKQNENPSG
jgi:hypothetical protein